ncbi:uncharacterized protein LOC100175825 [Ciona intestinalis]
MYKLSISNMLKYCVWAVVIFVFLQAGESSVEARRRKRKGADVSGPPSRRQRKHNKLNRNNHHALDSSLTSIKTDDKNTKIIDQYMKSRRRGSRKPSRSYTVKKWTEANVTVGTKVDELSLSNLEQSLGKFGHHSRRENIVGRVIHITDPGLENSHHGCGHTMSNRYMIPNNETWVALIKRGYCYFFNKIKLGERYNASAVVIYDDKPGKIEIMNTIGTNVVSLMISHEAGIKFAELADSGLNVYMNITVGREMRDRVREVYKQPVVSTYTAPEAIVSTLGVEGGSGSRISPSLPAIFTLVVTQLFFVLCVLNER